MLNPKTQQSNNVEDLSVCSSLQQQRRLALTPLSWFMHLKNHSTVTKTGNNPGYVLPSTLLHLHSYASHH